MELAELGLGTIPPIFAILVEALNPVSTAVLAASARRDFGDIGRDWRELANNWRTLAKEHGVGDETIKERGIETDAALDDRFEEQLIGQATKFGEGAVEVAGVVSTIVSVVSSGFAVVHELPNPFWPAVAYILFFMAVGLWLLRILGGQSFANVALTHPLISVGH